MEKRRFAAKHLIVMLAMLAVLFVLPFAVFAADGDVAEVDGVGYDTLQGAIDAAQAEDTVTVLDNIALTGGVTVPAGKEITLDLAGKTVSLVDSSAKGAYLITNKGDLTIDDSVGGGKITFGSTTPSADFGYSTSTIGNAGTLTVKDGTIENTTAGGASYAIDTLWYTEDVAINIEGGNITSIKVAIRQVLYTNANNVINVTGGEISGYAGIQVFNYTGAAHPSETNISGGKLSGTYAMYTSYGSADIHSGTEIDISGGEFDGYVFIYNSNACTVGFDNVSISGGHFENGGVWVYTVDSDSNYNYDPVVSGGTFTDDVSHNLAPDYSIVDNGDGTYGVAEDVAYIAEVNGVKYETLQAAIDAAGAGDTVLLLDNLTVVSDLANAGKGVFNVADGKSIVLDLNGKTIDVTDKSTGNFILIYVYGELTIKNGTITLVAENNREWNAQSSIILNRGGIVTVESGTYIHNGGTDMAFTFDNSGNWYGDAIMNIKGGTVYSTYTAIRNRMEQNSHGASGTTYLNISGGTVNGATSAVWAQAASSSTTAPATGEINVSGGEVGIINTARSSGAECMTTISGGTVSGFKGEVGELTVNGGTVTGNITILDESGEAVDYEIDSSGTYVPAGSVGVQWVGASVSVGTDLSISYYLNAASIDVSKLAVEFTMAGNTVLVKDYTTVDGMYVFKFSGIGPHQMTEVITAKAVLIGSGDVVEEELSTYDGYTIKDNCQSLLETGDDVTKRAVSDLLYYGAESQKYLGAIGELATDGVVGILDVDTSNVPNGDDFVGYGAPIGSPSANGSRLVSAGVMFDSTVKVYFRYTMGTGEFAIIKINGVDVIPMDGEGNKFTVYSADLNATQLDDELVVKLYVNGEVVQTLYYSASYYAYKMQNEATMGALAQALYRYGASAKAYSNK